MASAMSYANPIRIGATDLVATANAASGCHDGYERADDLALMRAAQAGDHEAFGELVERYQRVALRVALHLTRSESLAQDMVQEAFLRAFRSVHQFRFECSVFTWMHRILANVCIEFLRKQQARLDHAWQSRRDDEPEQDFSERIAEERPGGDPERQTYAHEITVHVRRALRRLSPRERLTFELKHYHGFSAQSIAAFTHTGEGSVKVTLCRALKKLRVELTRNGVCTTTAATKR